MGLYKELLQGPPTDDEIKHRNELEGKCHALWLLNGGETEEWNGDSCGCEYIQGSLNCKLNPF